MYNGIGLLTARGSGTNGYVQRNLSFVRAKKPAPSPLHEPKPAVIKKANPAILEHDRKRQVELQIMEYREELVRRK